MALEDARSEERARHIGRIMASTVRFLAAMVVRSFVRRTFVRFVRF